MSRIAERLTQPPYKKILLKSAASILSGAAVAAFLLPTSGESDSGTSRTGKPADAEAALLQKKVRHGQPVPYEANLGIKWIGHRPNGKPVAETTIMPLEFDPDANPHNGNEDYFRLIGNSVRTLKVRRIAHPTDLLAQQWDLQHPGVNVTSHEGVISTDNVTLMPATNIHLSNGEDRYVAIGQTSANP